MTEITEAIAIELTRRHLKNGQDEKPRYYSETELGGAIVLLSDGRSLCYNRVEVEHARIMLEAKK